MTIHVGTLHRCSYIPCWHDFIVCWQHPTLSNKQQAWQPRQNQVIYDTSSHILKIMRMASFWRTVNMCLGQFRDGTTLVSRNNLWVENSLVLEILRYRTTCTVGKFGKLYNIAWEQLDYKIIRLQIFWWTRQHQPRDNLEIAQHQLGNNLKNEISISKDVFEESFWRFVNHYIAKLLGGYASFWGASQDQLWNILGLRDWTTCILGKFNMQAQHQLGQIWQLKNH